MPRCRRSSDRSSTNSSARRSAKIEMELGSASFPRLRGSTSIPGKKPRALRECRGKRLPHGLTELIDALPHAPANAIPSETSAADLVALLPKLNALDVRSFGQRICCGPRLTRDAGALRIERLRRDDSDRLRNLPRKFSPGPRAANGANAPTPRGDNGASTATPRQ